MSAELDILDQVFIRMPCNACGQTYEVPLRDVLLSHTIVRCGCPVHEETECPPLFQIRLFDRAPIEALNSAWQRLARQARSDGGELVLREGNVSEYIQHSRTGSQYISSQHTHAEGGRIRQPVPTSGTLLSFDLSEEVERLLSEQPWQAEHTANTIAKYPDLRIVLIALKAGGRLHEHRTAGRLSIQTLSGETYVHVEGRTVEMHAGSLLTLEHDVAHDVEARSDSVLLLTITWPSNLVAGVAA